MIVQLKHSADRKQRELFLHFPDLHPSDPRDSSPYQRRYPYEPSFGFLIGTNSERPYSSSFTPNLLFRKFDQGHDTWMLDWGYRPDTLRTMETLSRDQIEDIPDCRQYRKAVHCPATKATFPMARRRRTRTGFSGPSRLPANSC